MKFIQTITQVSIHPIGVNPLFGESATHVRAEDEGGGVFIEIEQINDHIQPGIIRVDVDELEAIVSVAKMLVAQEGFREQI
jgi:hypothetical protein